MIDGTLQCLNWTFFYFKTIAKQVLQLLLISIVGTDVSVKGSLIWEEAGVPGKNPRVQADAHHTFSHTTTVDHGDRTRSQRWEGSALSSALLGQCLVQDLRDMDDAKCSGRGDSQWRAYCWMLRVLVRTRQVAFSQWKHCHILREAFHRNLQTIIRTLVSLAVKLGGGEISENSQGISCDEEILCEMFVSQKYWITNWCWHSSPSIGPETSQNSIEKKYSTIYFASIEIIEIDNFFKILIMKL